MKSEYASESFNECVRCRVILDNAGDYSTSIHGGIDSLVSERDSLKAKLAGVKEFFRTYEMSDVDKLMANAADLEMMSYLGAECAKRTKEYVALARRLGLVQP